MADERPAKRLRIEELNALATYIERLPYNVIANIVQRTDDPLIGPHLTETYRQALDKLNSLTREEAMFVWRPLARRCFPGVTTLMASLQRSVRQGRIHEGQAWALQIARLGTWFMRMTFSLYTVRKTLNLQPFLRFKTCSELRALTKVQKTKFHPLTSADEAFSVTVEMANVTERYVPDTMAAILQVNPVWGATNPQRYTQRLTTFVDNVTLGISYARPEPDKPFSVALFIQLHWQAIDDAMVQHLDNKVNTAGVNTDDYATTPLLRQWWREPYDEAAFVQFLVQLPIPHLGQVAMFAPNLRYVGTTTFNVQKAVVQFGSMQPGQIENVWKRINAKYWPDVRALVPSLQEKVHEKQMPLHVAWGWHCALLGKWIQSLATSMSTPSLRKPVYDEPFLHASTLEDVKMLADAVLLEEPDTDEGFMELDSVNAPFTIYIHVNGVRQGLFTTSFQSLALQHWPAWQPAEFPPSHLINVECDIGYAVAAEMYATCKRNVNGELSYFVRARLAVDWEIIEFTFVQALDVQAGGLSTKESSASLLQSFRANSLQQQASFAGRVCGMLAI